MIDKILNLKEGEVLEYESLTFDDLFSIKQLKNAFTYLWYSLTVTAETKNNTTISPNVYKKGETVLIWMVSRFGDLGITDNLIDAKGYELRGVIPEELNNYKIKLKPRRKSEKIQT